MRTVSVQELQEDAQGLLLDVRTPAEYEEVHPARAVLHPLGELNVPEIRQLAASRPIYVLCRTGNRARQAGDKLQKAGLSNIAVVEGGVQAWEAAGLPVVRGRRTISLERQVRIAAGVMVLTGLLLGLTVHSGFLGVSGFVGGGLIFAGITDWCGIGLLLARMPWNKRACPTKGCREA